MSADIVSRPYNPDTENCCERCVFGRGAHADWCEKRAGQLQEIGDFVHRGRVAQEEVDKIILGGGIESRQAAPDAYSAGPARPDRAGIPISPPENLKKTVTR